MNERFDITNDAPVPAAQKAAALEQQPRHTTSRLALLLVGFVAVCGLALGVAQYWRSSYVSLPPIYGVDRTATSTEDGSPEINESNYETELAEMELEYQESEAELDESLDEIDAEFEAELDSR